MKTGWTVIIKAVIIVALLCGLAEAIIQGTPHDLSVIGGANSCSFCHTPHGASADVPSWNHKLSTAVYKIYQSSSLEADVGQPTGSSKLCLSCHDGTVALTQTVSGRSISGTHTYIPPGAANLGTDLSDDHPVSFVYSAALSAEDIQIRPASVLPQQLKLDRSQELQCTTCHDPHDNTYGDFLVMSNRRSQMCVNCHDLYGWKTSSHENSTALVFASNDSYLQDSKYGTVADNACLSCHRPHSAGGHERLLHFANSENNCLNCHNGSVARTNLRRDLSKLSRHNVARYDGIHDLRESPTASASHIECVDCHNPHAIQDVAARAPIAPGAMREVSGVTSFGSVTQHVQYEYEVCFKCHGDNPNRIESMITRQITQTNTRLEFDPSGPSFHPVISPGANQNVPSLKSPMSAATVIYCIDCHNSDSASGTKGPHGSNYPNLLAYRYETTDFTSESESAYELCYKCHSRNSILNDESFSKHEKHLDEQIPCSACHDPHGISAVQGTTSNNTHLINFDITIVSSDSAGRLRFEDLGVFHGRCFLKCHNHEHSSEEY
ncbi:MAG: cytochrome c3 family protein [Planctomycetota bacterium]|jgi:predicted CXXCH cytochrome family protein